jgi:general secretion pathway protein F/type IV pilus assembly protein PilC
MSLGHRKLSAWYNLLAQQLESGLTFADALRLSRGIGAPSADVDAMAATVEGGGSIDDALARAGAWLPSPDRLFLSAAASAGRMPRTLFLLSARHALLGSAKLRTLLACLYPVAVLHLGLFLLPLMRMIDWEKGYTWDPAAYVRGLAFTLLPLWGAGCIGWILLRRQNPAIVGFVRLIPIVGNYLRARALSDFSFALGNFLEAGVPIEQAWAVAGTLSQSSRLRNAADAVGLVIARGEQPGLMLAGTKGFPADFVALYRSGELSGQLEQNLLRLSTQYQEQAQRSLTVATIVYPGLMFVAVAAGVGYFVITIYGGYFKMLTSLADG